MNYVSKLERGISAVTVDVLARLADALGVPATSLISEGKPKITSPQAAKEQLQSQIARLLSRNDAVAIESLSVVAGLMDNALARRAK